MLQPKGKSQTMLLNMKNRFDRSMGKALAVEQLLTKSFVFDTNILRRPDAEVVIVAAKRDYV